MLFKVKLQEQIEKKQMKLQKFVSLRQISRETGISRPTLDRWLHTAQKQIDARKVAILCNYFECDIRDFLEFVQE
ncbi:helix-turn-helix domain-containing protein [Ornithinibacillus xuwenensis]|uniref:Helix-turn-helix transcriptional regulator n=1 Tax=Ornithinibacillus xuwenensis TaxID=3144668 RepID=A0ABU9XBV8_9BACI